jgi:hypothetical protein
MTRHMKRPFLVLATMFACHLAWAAGEAATSAQPSVLGEVLEVLDGGAFTYMRLRTATGEETWAAARRAAVTKGTQVTLEDPVMMQNFESKALKRTFDTVVFGTLAGSGNVTAPVASAPPVVPPTGAGAHSPHGGPTAMPGMGTVKVAKAEGADARTVAEVHADRLALKDRTVTIRASVVKVTPGVMGRNWIHLRDGSGLAADRSDDIVVTSNDEPKLGDVVVASGVVRTDVNLGSGYAYKVLVEDATFRK